MTKPTDEKREMPRAGNFPVDQFQIDTLDPNTGEVTFRRISMADRYLTKDGAEILDARPAAPSLGKKPEVNIRDYIRSLVHNERLQQELDSAGAETFEEANDFEVGEDYFPDSQYENDLEPSIAELIREGSASLSAKARAEEKRAHDAKVKKRQERLGDEADPPSQPKKSSRKPPKGLLEGDEPDPDDHNPVD